MNNVFSPIEQRIVLINVRENTGNILTLEHAHWNRCISFSMLRKKQSSSSIDAEIYVRLFFWLTLGEQATGIWHQRPPLELWKNLSQLLDRASWKKIDENSFKEWQAI